MSVSGERHGWSYLQLDETSALMLALATDDFLVGIVLITVRKQAKGKETERLQGNKIKVLQNEA